MKALTPSILPQTMSWNPGAEKAPLSFLLLGVVYCHVVIEDHKQEKRHAQHVGEDGELHVRDHPDQLQPTPTLQTHKLEVGDLSRNFVVLAGEQRGTSGFSTLPSRQIGRAHV